MTFWGAWFREWLTNEIFCNCWSQDRVNYNVMPHISCHCWSQDRAMLLELKGEDDLNLTEGSQPYSGPTCTRVQGRRPKFEYQDCSLPSIFSSGSIGVVKLSAESLCCKKETGSGAGPVIERQTFEQSGWPTITSNWLDFFTELNRTEFKLQMGERKTSMPSWCCTRTAFSFIQWTIYRKTGQQPVQ